jgi:hypothetical protein
VLFVAAGCWISGCNSGGTSAAANGTPESGSQPAARPSQPAGQSAPANQSATKELPEKLRPTLRPGAKTVALERAGDRSYDKTFDDIRFEIEPGAPFHRSMLPESIEAMAGQRIRIRGFILPTPQKRGIRAFVLVRDNQECCFGPGAAIYDCILVEMQPGKTAEFSIRPVAVEGTFDIREVLGPDKKHLAIYHLEGESVR